MSTQSHSPSYAFLLAEAIRFEHWARFHCMREHVEANNNLHDGQEKSTQVCDTEKNTTSASKACESEHAKSNTAPENTEPKNTAHKDIVHEDMMYEDITVGSAYIQIPDVLIDVCQEEVPHLIPLLESLQDSEVSLDSARDHIMGFLQNSFNLDEELFCSTIQEISVSKPFTRYLDIFYTYVQDLAELEEAELTKKEQELSPEAFAQFVEEAPIPTFATWTAQFYQWAEERKFRLEL